MVRRHQVEVVVAHAIDRLARDPVHLGVVLSEAEHAGVEVEFVTEPLDQSPEGQLIRFVRGYAAKVEHEKIRERMNRGKLARVQSGKPLPGPRPPYGYRWVDAEKSVLEVDEPTAAVVRRIFASIAAGRSIHKTALALTEEGVPTPTGLTVWKDKVVHEIVRHPVYLGQAAAYRYRTVKRGGVVRAFERAPAEQHPLAGVAPPIVDAAAVAAAHASLARDKNRGSGRARRPETHLLRGGYARCGYCGGALYTGHWGSGNPYYYCGGYRHDPGYCPHSPTITGSVLDRAVWSKVEMLLTRSEVIAAELERLQRVDPDEGDIAALDRAMLDLARRQANLSRVIGELSREDAEPLVRELTALGQQKRQLEAERNAVMTRRSAWRAARARVEELQAWCRQVAARLTTLDHAGKQLALDALGVSVAIYARGRSPRFMITARIPLTPTPGTRPRPTPTLGMTPMPSTRPSTIPPTSTTPSTPAAPDPGIPPGTVPTSGDPDEQAGTLVSPKWSSLVMRRACFSKRPAGSKGGAPGVLIGGFYPRGRGALGGGVPVDRSGYLGTASRPRRSGRGRREPPRYRGAPPGYRPLLSRPAISRALVGGDAQRPLAASAVRVALERRLVELDAEAGLLEQLDLVAFDLDRVAGDLGGGRLPADEVLHDQEIRHHGGRLHARRQADRRRVVAVRRDRDAVRLGHRRDLFDLEQPADVADVGVDDVGGALLEAVAEVRLGVERLAGHNRDVDLRPHLGRRVEVLGRGRLLVPEDVVLLDRLGDADRMHRGEPAMHLDQELDLRADSLANGSHTLDGRILDVALDDRVPGTGERVELDRGDPAVDQPLAALGQRALAIRVGVDADPVAAGAAEQVVDRLLGDLSNDVPHRQLEPRERAVEVESTALDRHVAPHRLCELLDVERIAADDVGPEVLDHPLERLLASGQRVCLAPAMESGVRFELDEEGNLAPRGLDQPGLDGGDLHGGSSFELPFSTIARRRVPPPGTA
jgi:site-specific DNA recombinase